ncbi:type IV pilus modification protein PilV [Zooshikella marina]|uniref:type IV pilus modification protein PilV n=1 Tax=Zooshikella ganghwensis TaxID=202772 RepID=UPI001BAF595B|nr:type IV pilus modification protein PilV [Zooshikella ganghwensis]MBU2707405.1 type IV pilus modification protein PilV [Zooshikella ganghwensis]
MKTKIKNQTGVSMIEVLVTIVITSVALLGLAALLTKSMQSTFDASQRTTAVWAANDFVERYRMEIEAYASSSSLVNNVQSQIYIEHSLDQKLAGQNPKPKYDKDENAIEIRWNCTSCKNSDDQAIKLLLN